VALACFLIIVSKYFINFLFHKSQVYSFNCIRIDFYKSQVLKINSVFVWIQHKVNLALSSLCTTNLVILKLLLLRSGNLTALPQRYQIWCNCQGIQLVFFIF